MVTTLKGKYFFPRGANCFLVDSMCKYENGRFAATESYLFSLNLSVSQLDLMDNNLLAERQSVQEQSDVGLYCLFGYVQLKYEVSCSYMKIFHIEKKNWVSQFFAVV